MEQYSVLEDKIFFYLVKPQSLFSRFCKKVFDIYCKIIFTIYTPLTIMGQEKIPDKSYIMCCNHNSHMDVALLVAASGKGFSHFGLLAARDYWFYSRLKRRLTNLVMNLIPIDRKSQGEQSFTLNDTIALCRDFMKLGDRSLIMFPEGTRGTPGEMRRFKKGAATFSIKLNVPIVPLYIYGSYKAWPKGKLLMRPFLIKIEIGDPIYPNEYLEKHVGTEYDSGLDPQPLIQFTRDLEDQIRNMGEKYNV